MLRATLVIVAILLLQSVAEAAPFRQLTPNARTVIRGRNVVVFNNSLIVPATPRVETPDHWETARASYFQRMYGTRSLCR